MTAKIKVECLECGKKFQTTKTTPSCPRCGGSDIDVR
jgi:Zn finger protein HypA/HybF involved in hydrogenase expression